MPLQAGYAVAYKIREAVLDGDTVRAYARKHRRRTGGLGRQRLHLDFRHVEGTTASGLGQLVVLHKALRALGGRLTLGNVGERVFEVFEVTHLNRLLNVRRATVVA